MFGFLKREKKTAESSTTTARSWRKVVGAVFRREKIDLEFWDQLEEALIVSDVGVNTSMELVEKLRDQSRRDGVSAPESVKALMRAEIVRILEEAGVGSGIPRGRSVALMMVGVNGSGKTTTLGKLAHAARAESRATTIVAADTFRAGAIEQLRSWADRSGSAFVSAEPGADPGSVVYDGLHSARASGSDFVIIDTAGRLQTSNNLMEELKKVRRILNRESVGYETRALLVMDGNTGQNGLSQARLFNEAVNCDGVALTKLDSTAKGGIAIAISGETSLPIWYVGIGEEIDDLAEFNAREFADSILPAN